MELELKYNGTEVGDMGQMYYRIGTEEDPESLMGENGFHGDEQDAHLIAAAPELLEALQIVKSNYEYFGSDSSKRKICRLEVNQWLLIEQAINKAEGNE